jgi:hypothetical protein
MASRRPVVDRSSLRNQPFPYRTLISARLVRGTRLSPFHPRTAQGSSTPRLLQPRFRHVSPLFGRMERANRSPARFWSRPQRERSDSAALVESFFLNAARGAGFRGTALASRARLGASRLHLGSHRCGRRWLLGQRSAFALQSLRLGPGGRLAGCAWGGRLPCSRCLSDVLRCSLVAAFADSGGLWGSPSSSVQVPVG